MIAACAAAECGHQVTICEKNDRLGRKLFITGKGRCNITNACDMEGLFDAVLSNPKFLYSSFYGFSNQDVIDFFERIGVRTYDAQSRPAMMEFNGALYSYIHNL